MEYKIGIMFSIQPRYCELIVSGAKSVEVRKTVPHIITSPFTGYIYCTQKGKTTLPKGKVIGEFTCKSIDAYGYNKNHYGLIEEKKLLALSCLTEKELYHYLQGKRAYGINISDLVVYDKPLDISEFKNPSNGLPLKRAPQSWQYVVRYY